MRGWLKRSVRAWRELRELADVARFDLRWWVVAGAAAAARVVQEGSASEGSASKGEPTAGNGASTTESHSVRNRAFDTAGMRPLPQYLASNGEATSDTYLAVVQGHGSLAGCPVAIAYAARRALLRWHGKLGEQPLACNVGFEREGAAHMIPNPMSEVALVVEGQVLVLRLCEEERSQAAAATGLGSIVAATEGSVPCSEQRALALERLAPHHRPFVTIVLDECHVPHLRHLHRHAWQTHGGPFWGIGAHGDQLVVSTCHLAIDGYGHALLTQALAQELARVQPCKRQSRFHAASAKAHDAAGTVDDPNCARLAAIRAAVDAPADSDPYQATMPADSASGTPARFSPPARANIQALPRALAVASLTLPTPGPRALALAYATGQTLRRRIARPSLTLQLPVAPQHKPNASRAIAALLVARDETYAAFAERGQHAIAATRANHSILCGLMQFAQALPLPLHRKRQLIAQPSTSQFTRRIAETLAGHACISVIRLRPEHRTAPSPGPMIAVSAPALAPTTTNPSGGIVITLVDDGSHATLSVCGAGLIASNAAAAALLADIVAALPR